MTPPPRTSMAVLRSDHLGPLAPGARVAVLGTAGPPSQERLDLALDLLHKIGVEPVAYPTARAAHTRASYLSGSDQARADDFVRAWTDPDIDGIVCARGGYGTVRMLDLLDADRLAQHRPKPVYGSSDVTALHEWLAEHLGVASWFTPMPATADLLDDEVAQGFFTAAFRAPWRGLHVPAGSVLVPGSTTGTLIGGNLSLLALTLGARRRRAADHTGTIVVLEDVGEDTYRLDGYLTALLRAGWFDGVAGIALGSWKNCESIDEVKELVVEATEALACPVIADLDLGHGPGSRCIPLGVEVALDQTGLTVC